MQCGNTYLQQPYAWLVTCSCRRASTRKNLKRLTSSIANTRYVLMTYLNRKDYAHTVNPACKQNAWGGGGGEGGGGKGGGGWGVEGWEDGRRVGRAKRAGSVLAMFT